jgi:tRNA threonylcarbamoyladenosine biosynthesis protein TsaE
LMQVRLDINSESEMIRLGELLGLQSGPGDLLFLFGDLGAGKTTLTKGIARGLEVGEVVSSPTFQLVKRYQGRYTLNHLDLYRLNHPEELDVFEPEAMVEEGVTVVEWGSLLLDRLQQDHLEVEIRYHSGGRGRTVLLKAFGSRYQQWVERFNNVNFRN